jgi:glucose-6-phosphate isomerase
MDREKNLKSKAFKFDLKTGISPSLESKKRKLSDMEGMYLDNDKLLEMVNNEDIIVYEFYNLGIKADPANLAYGTTIIYPGKVGKEYFMTKGHFHEIINTAEIYYCLKGHGYLLMENPEGKTEIREMKPGISVYVPPRFAHRTINVSEDDDFVLFFTFRADAGHDYKTIESKGFRKLLIEQNGKPILIDNPKWK